MMDWITKRLDEVLFIQEGPGIRKYEYEDGGYPMINVRCVQDGHIDMSKSRSANHELATNKWAHFQVDEGDILYTISGTIGRSAIVKKSDLPLLMNTSVVRFKSLIDELDTKFVYYCFKTDRFISELLGYSTGTAIKNVGPSHLKKMTISYPSVSEQKRIVAILDQVFADIEQARAKTEQNLKNARELFESYLQQVFSQRGEGWEIKKVSEIAETCLGKMLDKKKNKGSPKPYLRNQNVQWFDVNTDDLLEMRFEDGEYERYAIKKGDLVICEGGYPGRGAIWEQDEDIFFQKALHRIRSHNEIYNRWILYYLYLSDCNGSLTKSFTGAGIQHFTGKALKQLSLPVPKVELAEKYVSKFDQLFDQIICLENVYHNKLSSIDELKKSILHKAFSGELDKDKGVAA